MNFYEHQKQVVAEKDRPDRLRFGNWRGTGSGKTRTTVAIAEGLTLVICPKTQADEEIWQDEWRAQGRDSSQLVVLSKEQFKKKFAINPLLVCNGLYPNTVIIDEAHTVAGLQPSERQKNYKKFPRTSQIFDAVVGYVRLANPRRIVPLTATPTPNPMALFALGIILGRDWNYHKFREMFYFEKEIRGRKLWLVNRSKANQELLLKTKESIGYTGTLDDWFDVPPQIFKPPHYVGVTAEQDAKYAELKVLYPDPLILTGKRQKLEQGLFDRSEIMPDSTIRSSIEYVPENKTEAIDQYMQEFKRVVVFARYTEQIETYKRLLGKKYKVMTLTGATKNRKAFMEEARAAEECLFIAQCEVSAGWELPDYPCMIFASLDYSLVNYDQAIGRIHRANNLKKNVYIFLVAGDGDEKVYKAIHEKEEFADERAFAQRYGKELCESKKLRSRRS